jgi:hypothetical protein
MDDSYHLFMPIGYDKRRPWPGVNQITGLLKSQSGRVAYHRIKKHFTDHATLLVLSDPNRPRLDIVEVTFRYVLKDRRMDPDNIGGMIRKFILDGVTDGRKPGIGCGKGKGLFVDDSQHYIKAIHEQWQVGEETGVHLRVIANKYGWIGPTAGTVSSRAGGQKCTIPGCECGGDA